jgi:hypothetical protein
MRPCHVFAEYHELDRNTARLLQTARFVFLADRGSSYGWSVSLYQDGSIDSGRALRCVPHNLSQLSDAAQFDGDKWFIETSVARAYDYPAMQRQMQPLRADLLRHIMHPSRVHTFAALQLV